MLGRSSTGAVLQVCLLVLRLCSSVSQQTVQKCPQTKADWDRESVSLQCQEPNFYHCLRDDTGWFMQLCAQRAWIQKEMCPEFNSRIGRIDVFECPSGQTGCPTTIFWSNAVFLYPECYRNSTKAALSTTPGIPVTTVNENTKDNTQSGSDKADDQILTVGLVCAGVVIVFGVVFVIYIYRRKRQRSNRRNDQDYLKTDNQTEDKNQTETFLRGDPEGQGDVQEMQGQNRSKNAPYVSRGTEEQDVMLSKVDNGNARDKEKLINDDTQKLEDLIKKCEEEKDVYIFAWLYSETVDKREVETEARNMLNIPINLHNNFKTWKVNKSEDVYVFDDWITSDGNENTGDVLKVLIEVLTAVLNRKTKFVFVIPRVIWLGNPGLKAIQDLRICRKKY
uniref:Uncharacterized protein LOC111121565 isoform X3 n=1 Tax=Crassostrea virginica TaxID=6565 RepID=A0A8B8CVY0_CRAVI|nr:uncharacterized protein LOC111121565 isoform X3 [Crassostrea virginica]